jgi:F-type H+-transporting ATPase subunit c
MKYIGTGLSTVGIGGAGIGVGIIFGSLIISISMNPKSKDTLFGIGILGFALCEALGLFSLMIGFIILYG